MAVTIALLRGVDVGGDHNSRARDVARTTPIS
jgi:uncharacterized protein (DUF1697 family)